MPQAVGRTRDGDLVFGWCLDCLKTTGCTEIAVAHPPRGARSSTRLDLEGPPGRTFHTGRARRSRVVVLVTSLLAVWGLALLAAGVRLLLKPSEGSPSPFGNGTPVLLLVGGGATLVTSLLLGLTLIRAAES